MGVGSRKNRGEGGKIMSINNSLRFAVRGDLWLKRNMRSRSAFFFFLY